MSQKIPVTVVIISKNEESNIGKCLSLLSDFDEVVVVDSESTDKTLEIAKTAGVKTINFKWNGKFPKKRNWCLRNVILRNKWVLFLDADEFVTESFKTELKKKIPKTKYHGYWLTYHNHFMGKKLRHGDMMRKLALFRLGSGEYERIEEDSWSHLDMEVHEHPIIEGQIGMIKAPINHYDYKGLDAYIERHNAYSTWEANRYLALKRKKFTGLTRRQRMKYALMGSWLLGPLYFFGTYFVKLGFIDGKPGFSLALFKLFYFWQIKCKIDEISLESEADCINNR